MGNSFIMKNTKAIYPISEYKKSSKKLNALNSTWDIYQKPIGLNEGM